MVFFEEKLYEDALKNFNTALKIQEKLLGSADPNIARTYNNIGKSCVKLNREQQALEYYQKALSIQKKMLQ